MEWRTQYDALLCKVLFRADHSLWICFMTQLMAIRRPHTLDYVSYDQDLSIWSIVVSFYLSLFWASQTTQHNTILPIWDSNPTSNDKDPILNNSFKLTIKLNEWIIKCKKNWLLDLKKPRANMKRVRDNFCQIISLLLFFSKNHKKFRKSHKKKKNRQETGKNIGGFEN